jgi:hypothetical protein
MSERHAQMSLIAQMNAENNYDRESLGRHRKRRFGFRPFIFFVVNCVNWRDLSDQRLPFGDHES